MTFLGRAILVCLVGAVLGGAACGKSAGSTASESSGSGGGCGMKSACQSQSDCCDGVACTTNVCCNSPGAECQRDGDCCVLSCGLSMKCLAFIGADCTAASDCMLGPDDATVAPNAWTDCQSSKCCVDSGFAPQSDPGISVSMDEQCCSKKAVMGATGMECSCRQDEDCMPVAASRGAAYRCNPTSKACEKQ